MISSTTEYALKALATLARLKRADSVCVQEVSDASGVPRNYLSKIFNELRRRGVVVSVRGPGGGFKLSKRAEDITILSVVEIFEDLDQQRKCFLGSRYCTSREMCGMAARWTDVWNSYERFLSESTITDLSVHNACHDRNPAE